MSEKINPWLKQNIIYVEFTLEQKLTEGLPFSTKNWCRHIIFIFFWRQHTESA